MKVVVIICFLRQIPHTVIISVILVPVNEPVYFCLILKMKKLHPQNLHHRNIQQNNVKIKRTPNFCLFLSQNKIRGKKYHFDTKDCHFLYYFITETENSGKFLSFLRTTKQKKNDGK